METPAATRIGAGGGVDVGGRVRRDEAEHVGSLVLRGVAVAVPQATSEHAAAARGAQQRRRDVCGCDAGMLDGE